MRNGVIAGKGLPGAVSLSRLEEAVAEFLKELRERRYSEVTLKEYARYYQLFSSAVEAEREIELIGVSGEVERFISKLNLHRTGDRRHAHLLRRFLRYLAQSGRLPSASPLADRGPFGGLVSEYEQFLRDHRGVGEGRVRLTQAVCEAFLAYAATSETTVLKSMPAETVHGFIRHEGEHYSRRSMHGRCSVLRGFLAHLHRRGHTTTDLSPFVLAPRTYVREGCPRFLTASEVRAVQSSVDRRRRIGKRDYAILLLLATYGLRGIEVARLRLDDIDWRGQMLHIRERKAGNGTSYPLSTSVGEAILSYLKRGRPESRSRNVFLISVAPYGPIKSISTIVKRRIGRAGVRIDRPGTHTFRYSCAQRLLQKGFPMKVIGDYLGHRSVNTTRGYTRIAVEELREVALGDGEALV